MVVVVVVCLRVEIHIVVVVVCLRVCTHTCGRLETATRGRRAWHVDCVMRPGTGKCTMKTG